MLQQARVAHPTVAAGRFGADMQVTLTNDGPVTIWLRVAGVDSPGGGS
jgi:D-tyrosyl-tRNA(Tyr) deacylase